MASRSLFLLWVVASLAGPARAEPSDPVGPGAATPEEATIWKVPVDAAVDPRLGPEDALVTLVVFSDYQCPYCKRLEATIGELRERYRADLRVVMRHNPLPFHAQAMPAARAAVCAHAQKKFAPMHEGLMQASYDAMSEGLYLGLAKQLGLDLRAFDACLAARSTSERIAADQAAALAVGARATPTSFVNGRKVSGAQPLAVFIAAIDAELARARAASEAGVPRRDLYAALIAKGRSIEPLGPRVAIETRDAPRVGPPEAPIALAWFGSFGGVGAPCKRCGESLAAVRGLVAESRGRLTATFHLVSPATPAAQSSARAIPAAQSSARATPAAQSSARAIPAAQSSARALAEAAMCAHLQGAFLDFSDLLFDALVSAAASPPDVDGAKTADAVSGAAKALGLDDAKTVAAVTGAAKALGLDVDKLFACAAAQTHAALLDGQDALARSLELSTTPAIFIDGRRLDPSVGLSREALQGLIDRTFPPSP